MGLDLRKEHECRMALHRHLKDYMDEVSSSALIRISDFLLEWEQKQKHDNINSKSIKGVVRNSYYYLKHGDEIKSGDEYREESGEWHKTGQLGRKFNTSIHYKHRRIITV